MCKPCSGIYLDESARNLWSSVASNEGCQAGSVPFSTGLASASVLADNPFAMRGVESFDICLSKAAASGRSMPRTNSPIEGRHWCAGQGLRGPRHRPIPASHPTTTSPGPWSPRTTSRSPIGNGQSNSYGGLNVEERKAGYEIVIAGRNVKWPRNEIKYEEIKEEWDKLSPDRTIKGNPPYTTQGKR